MPTERTDWLYATQASEVCGITPNAWRRAVADTEIRPATAKILPGEHRWCPDTGRPQWHRRAVERYRDRGNTSQSANNHRRVVEQLARTGSHPRVIAARTGLHVRTVQRHLSGTCSCDA